MPRTTRTVVVWGLVLFTACWGSLVLATGHTAPQEMGRLLGAMSTEYPDWFKESFLEFGDDINEAATEGKRLLVMFHQDSCPYCNALVERNLSQRHIEEKVRKHFDVVAVNMWGDRELLTLDGKSYTEKSFAQALRVQFTPTLIFFDEGGNVVLRLNGYLPPQRFETALDYVALKKEKEIAYRDFVAARSSSPASGVLNAEDFFSSPPYDLVATSVAGKPIAVFFEQKQCPNCDRLHARVMQDPVTREIVKQFTCIQLDMWANTPLVTPSGEQTTARKWAKVLDVKYAPSIVLFDPTGEEIIRSEAFFKVFHTQSIFDYVLSGGYKTESSFQRFISARAERIREQGKDVNIWK
jgi:thioredoxin-related protein